MSENQLIVVMSPQSLEQLQILLREAYAMTDMTFERLVQESPITAYQVIVLMIKNQYVVRFTDQKGISVDSAGDSQEAVDNQIKKHGRFDLAGSVIHVTILLRPRHGKTEVCRDEPWIIFRVTPGNE